METKKTNLSHSFKCHFCPVCNGCGCINELPGMGGFNNNINFKKNCVAWKEIKSRLIEEGLLSPLDFEVLPKKGQNSSSDYIRRIGPMTGGVENAGYFDEKQFYFDLIQHALDLGLKLSIGDGCPDEKIQYGIEAVKSHNEKAAVFIKPYPNPKILERIEWAEDVAEYIGIDIDSYNILTMRNLVKLEKKTPSQLMEIKKSVKVPFIIKGIFTESDIELVKELKPDVVFISNHGGRVENRIGSTAEFLYQNGKVLKNYCDEIWVDGGIRTKEDEITAHALGAKQILIGRPVITSLCKKIHYE